MKNVQEKKILKNEMKICMTQVYSEHWQTSKMEHFTKIIKC